MTPLRLLFALPLLAACATADPFDDVARAQQRLDERGFGFGVTRVPGHDAFVLQLRISTSDTESELNADPMAAAAAAAPAGCAVGDVAPQEDGLSYHVEYAC